MAMRPPFFSLLALLAVALVAPSAAPAQPQNLGDIVVQVGTAPIAVSVTGSTPDLSNLANVAFEAHGRYRRVAGGAQFDLRFTAVAPNQVRVDVAKAGAP